MSDASLAEVVAEGGVHRYTPTVARDVVIWARQGTAGRARSPDHGAAVLLEDTSMLRVGSSVTRKSNETINDKK